MVEIIKIGRLKWLGHLARMKDNVPCMKITFYQPKVAGSKEGPD